jgi:dienelactone hydrolase
MGERDEGGLFLDGGADGCLILSDIADGPAARALAGELNRSGFTVSAPALYTARETLAGAAPSNWKVWLDRAREAYARLSRARPSVAVAGLGVGAALALVLAAEYPVFAVAAVSPVLRVRCAPERRRLAPDRAGPEGEAPRARDVFALTRLARRSLFAVVSIRVHQDGTFDFVREAGGEAHPGGAHLVFTGISSRQKRMLVLTQPRPNSPGSAHPGQAWDAIKSHLRLASAANTLVNPEKNCIMKPKRY